MEGSGTGGEQESRQAAKMHEESSIHLFKTWIPRLADAAWIKPGDRVLDVGCGTGLLARYLNEHRQAQVTGIDQNQWMLSRASAIAPQIRWDHGRAELLPYPNNSFDAVLSQFALSLFHDAEDAVKEMIRVVRPGRSIAVTMWDSLESSSAYHALSDLFSRQFGEKLTDRLSLDRERLVSLFLHPGIHAPQISTLRSTVNFPSISSWIRSRIRWWSWTNPVTQPELEAFFPIAEMELARYADRHGGIAFETSAHILSTVKEQLD